MTTVVMVGKPTRSNQVQSPYSVANSSLHDTVTNPERLISQPDYLSLRVGPNRLFKYVFFSNEILAHK